MLFENDTLQPDAVGAGTPAAEVLWQATARTAVPLSTGDLIVALIGQGEAKVLSVIARASAEGVKPRHISDTIAAYRPPAKAARTFDGRRASLSTSARAALDAFEAEVFSPGKSSTTEINLLNLLRLAHAIFSHLDEDDREYLARLNAVKATEMLQQEIEWLSNPPPSESVLFNSSGEIQKDRFAEDVSGVLRRTAEIAGELGFDKIFTPHLFIALLQKFNGVTEKLVRPHLPPQLRASALPEVLANHLRRAAPGPALSLQRESFGLDALKTMELAWNTTSRAGGKRITQPHLLAALLATASERLVSLLGQSTVGLDCARLAVEASTLLQVQETEPRIEVPTELLPGEDLTWFARTKGIPAVRHLDVVLETLERSLFRKTNRRHAVIVGPPGVGKTTLLRELARRAASGEIHFLGGRRFVWLDASDVAPENSITKAQALIRHFERQEDVVVCVEQLDRLLAANVAGTSRSVWCAALKRAPWQLVGLLRDREFEDRLGGERELLELFTVVKVAEPDKTAARQMVADKLPVLASEFGVRFDLRAADSAVTLGTNYILHDRHPAKAIRLLSEAAEDLAFDQSRVGVGEDKVTAGHVIRVVSRLTGVPEQTLAGIGDQADYAVALGSSVMGQPAAVRGAATELNLLRSGLTRPGKPASVMFFAGLTGCGKTELAKALARYYSTSKRLQVYTMGNFTESHSVAGLIGSPPGYIGHEQGGRLINDLLADPYGVFLLDEAEKAHPEVWKPFLNLFDEGWVVDQRGVKAFAERAIFILTSNEGSDLIAARAAAGDPEEKILAALKEHLSEVRHPQTRQRSFPPEFLARMGRIIVFRPLNQEAILDICRKMMAEASARWFELRQQQLVVPETLIEEISREGHRLNSTSGNKEGARVLASLIRDRVMEPLRNAALVVEAGEQANVVELNLTDGQVKFQFKTVPPRTAEQSLQQVGHWLRAAQIPGQAIGALEQSVMKALVLLEGDMPGWRAEDTQIVSGRKLQSELASLLKELNQERQAGENRLATTLNRLLVDTGGMP